MLQKFLSWIRGVLAKMLHISDAKQALKVDVAIRDRKSTRLNPSHMA